MNMNKKTILPLIFFSLECHVSNVNRKMNGNTNGSNRAIVQVPLDSLKSIGYRKVHLVIVWVPFQDFTPKITSCKA